MGRKIIGGAIACFMAILAFPLLTQAYTADFVSSTPALTDWTAEHAPEPPADNVKILVFAAESAGETYDVVLSVSEEPVMLVTVGCDLNTWSYDADAGQVLVNVDHTGFAEGIGDWGGYEPLMIAVVWPVALGEDGPPAEFAGSWMSTNLQDWEMIPPSPGNPVFGYNLSGPEGETGYFHMFIPQATIDLLSALEGVDLSIEDLAVYEDDEQASISVSEYDAGVYTGALIDINVTFTEDATTAETLSANVTKKLTVAKKAALSITAEKSSLKKNKTAHLFGWLKSGKKGRTVNLWRKLNGASKYKKIDTGTTLNNGYYEFDSVVKKTAKYKVKCNHKTSSVKKITVR